MDCVSFKRLSNQKASSLEAHFTSEEIKHALFGLGHDRAPGPDGFPIIFFQHFWFRIGCHFHSVDS